MQRIDRVPGSCREPRRVLPGGTLVPSYRDLWTAALTGTGKRVAHANGRGRRPDTTVFAQKKPQR